MTVETILAAMLALPTYYGDRKETLEQRTALYRPVAEAIYEESRGAKRPTVTAAILVAQAHEDSHLARYVLEGRCLEGPPGQRCDNGRSRGPFQVGRWCPNGGLRVEAHCAMRAAWGGVSRCHGRTLTPWHGAFAGLAARDCHWAPADKRVAVMKRVQVML